MKRKIYQELFEWKRKKNGKTALLIEGARRVGKSYIVGEFAKNEYKSYILIDFNNADTAVKSLFENYMNDPDTFFSYLSAIYNTKLYPKESLIIFDEVQLFPRARSAIKYLVADGRYHFIETGSLISIKRNVQDILIPSEEHHIRMYPMDFEEYLWARGVDTLYPIIREHFASLSPMKELHRKTMQLFREYLIIGGMPQAVDAYCTSLSFKDAEETKQDILSLYYSDIEKYTDDGREKVKDVFNEIPSQLQKHDRVFRMSSISDRARFREYKDAFTWLEEAMIINICNNSTEPSVGLSLNEDRMSRKCYMGDTGLLVSMAFNENGGISEELYRKLLFDKLEVNAGMLVENIVAQMFRASGHRLFFYTNPARDDKESRMEIDFLLSKKNITSRHNISPIEVKSSARYTLSSLRKFITKYKEQLHTPYVLHTSDLKSDDGIIYLPLYMTELL